MSAPRLAAPDDVKLEDERERDTAKIHDKSLESMGSSRVRPSWMEGAQRTWLKVKEKVQGSFVIPAMSNTSTKSNLVELTTMRRQQSLLVVAPNPFENRVPWTWYEVFKLLTVGPTLGVIRLFVLISSSLLGLIYVWIISIGNRYEYVEGCAFQKEPAGPIRNALLLPLAWLARLNCWCVGFWWVNVKDNRKPWKILKGRRLVGGKELLVKKMTVAAAQKLVENREVYGCKGFEFAGSGTGEVEITFKDTYDTIEVPEVEGTTYLHPVGKMITAAPHASLFDPFLVGTLFRPFPSAIATIDMIKGINCVMAPWFKSVGTIFVDRFSNSGKEAAKNELVRRADPDYDGPPTMIFPEGTTTNGKVLIQFKQGAFTPGEPVLPVCIRFPAKYLPISFTGDLHGASFVMRMMTQFVNHCEIELMEAYIPSPEERENDILYARNVRQTMAAHLGLSTSDHTVSDSALANVGLKLGAGNQLQNDFVMKEAVTKFGFTNEMCMDFIKIFQEADKNCNGWIDRAEVEHALVAFAKVGQDFTLLQLIAKHLLANRDKFLLDGIFDLINTDKTGRVTYREFLQCLAMCWNHTKERLEGRAKMAFLLLRPHEDTLTVPKEKLDDSVPPEVYAGLPDHVDWIVFRDLDVEYPHMVKGVMENRMKSRGSLPTLRSPEGKVWTMDSSKKSNGSK